MNPYTVTRHLRQRSTPDPLYPPPWTEQATCGEIGFTAFFPDDGEPAEPALRICRACPVRLQCLRAAVDRGERWGVWGGFHERARRRVRKQHAAGVSLEDIIAADDERHYRRLARAALRAEDSRRRRKARTEAAVKPQDLETAA